MWKKTLLAIATLAALSVSANARPPIHPHEINAAIGGVITGVLLSELANDSNVNVHLSSRSRDSWDRYDSNYRDYQYGRSSYGKARSSYDRSRNHHNSGGYYVYEKRRIWVPGSWDYVRANHGRTAKIWIRGHYETRNVKVWVNDRDHRNHQYRDNRCR